MNKKYTTTLSAQELEVIEKLLVEHGNVVNFDMIYEKLGKKKSRQEAKNFVSKIAKKGWLIRIKRGVYAISDISSRGSIELNQSTIAQVIDNKSYVSFEAALQHYGLFDQYLRIITSIGRKRTYTKKFSDWTFKYIKSKEGLYLGFKEFNIDGQLVKIALKEKALLDFLVYKRTLHNIDLVLEKIRDHRKEFDLDIILNLSKDCSLATKRTLGLIMDMAGIKSEELYSLVKNNKNYSYMASGSSVFNSKWRIYMDRRFINN